MYFCQTHLLCLHDNKPSTLGLLLGHLLGLHSFCELQTHNHLVSICHQANFCVSKWVQNQELVIAARFAVSTLSFWPSLLLICPHSCVHVDPSYHGTAP